MTLRETGRCCMTRLDHGLVQLRPPVPLTPRQELRFMAVMVALTAGLGLYLLLTSVLIADDGVYHIRQAQRLMDSGGKPPEINFLGYSWLVARAWRLATTLGAGPGGPTWIYTAQAVALFCRVLAVLVFYRLGRILVEPKDCLVGMVVLIALPEPAHWGSDALRDWTSALFIGIGLLAVMRGILTERTRWFAAAGVLSGLGCAVHLVAAQGALLGTCWLGWRWLRPAATGWTRRRLLMAAGGLWVCFAGAVWVVGAKQGFVIPERFNVMDEGADAAAGFDDRASLRQEAGWSLQEAVTGAGRVIQGLAATIEALAENLMWFFAVAAAIGGIGLVRSRHWQLERFMVGGLLLVNVLLCVVRYVWVEPHVSRRYMLTLTVVACFYVPAGLRIMARWWVSRRSADHEKTDATTAADRVFWILLVVGLAVCVPKLIRPMRADKQGYRDAAQWIARNTDEGTVIAVFDPRIALYADREGVRYLPDPQFGHLLFHRAADAPGRDVRRMPADVSVVVEDVRPGRSRRDFGVPLEEAASFALKRDSSARVIVSRVVR